MDVTVSSFNLEAISDVENRVASTKSSAHILTLTVQLTQLSFFFLN